MSSIKELSNLSYTNKDFNSIYVELLEYAKKLSYKWDPTASDESDPGVVLLKLISIIGDKDNYNIDKNVLELMPASVTQLPAARQIFEQCGYVMRYYRSAAGTVNFTLVSEPDKKDEDTNEYSYSVPMFTMLTDNDDSVVYTTTESVVLNLKETKAVNVIEGTVSKYTINNDPLITLLNLDNNRRLYFNDLNIAENGIFINNVGQENYEEWERVENIETQEANKKCYKFGITLDGTSCFIEFPEDIGSLMSQGININYISTSGINGNIASKKITKFYSDIKVMKYVKGNGSLSGEEVSLTTDNVRLSNTLAITNGADPESVDDAYRGYQRVKDTFDTLVSLKDYSDFMVSNEYASNGFVCDRTNDIQHSYKVKKFTGGTSSYETYIENSNEPLYRKKGDEYEEIAQPSMTPFDLCVYALTYKPNCLTESDYKATFILTDGAKYKNDLNTSDKIKCLQHTFKEFEPYKILFIKNKYPIKSTIIPRHKLTLSEKFEVEDNVRKALYQAVNSKNVDFGSQISYDLIYDTVQNADPRIKAVSVTYPTYETYAVYLKETEQEGSEIPLRKFAEVRVDSDYSPTEGEAEICNKFKSEIFVKNVLAGVTPLYDKVTDLTYSVIQQDTKYISKVEKMSTQTKLKLGKPKDVNKHWYETPELKENESILLVAPNLIEDMPYSSYVKMIYEFSNNDGSIAAEEYYELRDDDYIVFLWKAADSDTTYTYTKYTKDSNIKIISPSFTMSRNQFLGKTNDIPAYIKSLPVGEKQKLFDSTSNEYVKSLSSDTFVLTGTKVVKTYRANQIFINNETDGAKDVYWMLNNTDSSTGSVLFEAPSENDKKDAKYIQEYTLKSGEYLLYTNPPKTILYMLGEGTLITRKCNTISEHSAWQIPYKNIVTYEDLLAKGLTILEDFWYQIPPAEELYAMEMQQVLIGPGNIVRLQPNNSSINLMPSAESEYSKGIKVVYGLNSHLLAGDSYKFTKDQDSSDFIIFFYKQNSEEKYRYTRYDYSLHNSVVLTSNFDMNRSLSEVIASAAEKNPKGWEGLLSLPSGINQIIDDDIVNSIVATLDSDIFELSDDQVIRVSVKTPYFPYTEIDKDDSDLQLKDLYNYSISYVDSSTGQQSVVKNLNLKDYGWKGESVLNINLSPTIPQRLESHQKFVTDSGYILKGDQNKPLAILADSEITTIGGKNVVVKTRDNYAKLQPINLLTFTEANDTQTHKEDYQDVLKYNKETFEAILQVFLDESLTDPIQYQYETTFACKLLKGNYLFTINLDEGVTQFELSADDVTVTDMFKESKFIKTYKIIVENDSDCKFTISCTLKSSTAIVMKSLYKFETETLDSINKNFETSNSISKTFETAVLEKLATYQGYEDFDYTQESSSQITNPLAAESFVLSNHVYCPYTICEWQESSSDGSDISVTSELK